LLKKGENYSFVKDLREGYDDGLRLSLEEKIFNTLPNHVFHDIKVPIEKHEEEVYWHKYNPAKKNPNTNFFVMRANEDYFIRHKKKENIRENVSMHRRYWPTNGILLYLFKTL